MIRLETNVLGVYATKDGNVIERIDFPKDADKIAKKLSQTSDSTCDEELELLGKLVKSGVKEILVKNPHRFRGCDFDIKFIQDSSRSNPFDIAQNIGISNDEISTLISEVNMVLTRDKLKIIESDQLIIQAVAALSDIEEAANTLVERLREWYCLHFPELDHIVAKNDIYAALVTEHGNRKNFKNLSNKYDRDFEAKMSKACENSLGVEFNDDDLSAVHNLSAPIVDLYKSMESIQAYIESMMEDVAPNIKALAGGVLGARLMAHAGSLRRLAILPAGTIQILGAEDAFFRFLKTGKKPPKHGIIFQQPEIRGASRNIRGKLARTFSAKLAIAAKVDTFGGKFIADKLMHDFQKRVKSLGK